MLVGGQQDSWPITRKGGFIHYQLWLKYGGWLFSQKAKAPVKTQPFDDDEMLNFKMIFVVFEKKSLHRSWIYYYESDNYCKCLLMK